MNTSHTPGPWDIDWYICREGKKELWRVPRSIGPVSIDHNHWAGNHLNVSSADARLITAAPELLAALKMAVLQNEHDMLMTGEELRQCAAAIKKAEGT